MATGDLFKRSLEAGTSFLDMTRERAEAMVKEWVDAGDLGKGRAQKAVEQVLDRSRKASDELRAMVRKEIGVQLAALGVATRDDIARLEAKIDAARGASAPTKKMAAKKVTVHKAPAKATTAKKAAAKKAPAKKVVRVAKGPSGGAAGPVGGPAPGPGGSNAAPGLGGPNAAPGLRGRNAAKET